MKKHTLLTKVMAGGLVTVTLLGVAFAAGQQGTQSDPLVTLSYLTQKATPEIMTQVESKLTERETALKKELDQAIQDYTKAMEDKLAQAGGSSGQSAAFAVVDVAAGQKLTAGIGCEIMLPVGSAVCFTDTAPGFIDMTDGGTLENGQALVKNHLYMATIEGRGFTAQNAVKVLVRGSYTIS